MAQDDSHGPVAPQQTVSLVQVKDNSTPLTRDLLPSVQAISLLGQIAAKGLQDYGQITFYLNLDGVVEIAPTREVSLDAIPEPEALRVLLSAGYNDQALGAYLRGRDARRRAR